MSITRENLFTDDEGSLWLKYRRKKTNYLECIKLLPEAVALFEKYRLSCSRHKTTIRIRSGPT